MDKKYFYFGVRMKEVVIGTTGLPREKESAIWAPKSYTSKDEMMKDMLKAMSSRPGKSFFWQTFDRELDIDANGISKGFKAE